MILKINRTVLLVSGILLFSFANTAWAMQSALDAFLNTPLVIVVIFAIPAIFTYWFCVKRAPYKWLRPLGIIVIFLFVLSGVHKITLGYVCGREDVKVCSSINLTDIPGYLLKYGANKHFWL